MKNYLPFSFFAVLIVNFHLASGSGEHCAWSPCNSYTQPQVIRRLWDLAMNITPLGKKLAETMSDASREFKESDSTLNTIFAQNLWAVEVYSGFPHAAPISCVFERILNLTISEDECRSAEYNEAIDDFGKLVEKTLPFTSQTSLAVASCPTSYPPPIQPRPEECLCGYSVKEFMKKYKKTIPSNLRRLIKYLNKSPDAKDRTVAIILCALSRGPLNEYFQKVLQTPELLRALQLKACKIPIDDCCCKSREEDIRNRLAAFRPIFVKRLRESKKN